MPTGYPALHERVLSPLELAALRPVRQRLLSRAHGVVVEIGGGIGENISFYSAEAVTGVTIVAPDPWTIPVLERRVRDARVKVSIEADLAPLVPGTIDTVVSTFVLCSLPDRDRLLHTIREALHEDGRLLFVEHRPTRLARSVVGELAAPLWRAATTGCDLRSDPLAAIRAAGFVIRDVERFTMHTFQLPIRLCVAGVAR